MLARKNKSTYFIFGQFRGKRPGFKFNLLKTRDFDRILDVSQWSEEALIRYFSGFLSSA
jgi:hypothetical protein